MNLEPHAASDWIFASEELDVYRAHRYFDSGLLSNFRMYVY
jgi:hypothetical protein